MHAARTGYRQQQDERLNELEHTLPVLQQQLAQAQAEAAQWKAKYEDLKQRALNAYQEQKEEIERLKKKKDITMDMEQEKEMVKVVLHRERYPEVSLWAVLPKSAIESPR